MEFASPRGGEEEGKEEVLRRLVTPRGRRMTGSAQTRSGAVRFIMLLGEKKKERVWERKGLGAELCGKLADSENGVLA